MSSLSDDIPISPANTANTGLPFRLVGAPRKSPAVPLPQGSLIGESLDPKNFTGSPPAVSGASRSSAALGYMLMALALGMTVLSPQNDMRSCADTCVSRSSCQGMMMSVV